MKPSILLYVLCIHIASTSAHLPRFKAKAPRTSSLNHESPQDSINSWRSDDDPAVQREIDSNFILRSRTGHTAHPTEDEVHSLVTQQHPSRVPKTSAPAHLMDPSGFVTTPASRVDDHRSGIAMSRKRMHESSSDSSEDESYWPSSSTEQDQSESDAIISPRNSLDSRWTIHNRESISRNRIKRPAYDNEDRSRPSSSTSHSQLGVNHDLRPPQARDPRQSLNKEVAQVNHDRGSNVRQGIEQPSHHTETQSFSTIPTPNRQIQGHRDDVPPQPMDSERPNSEEVVQRADIASRVLNMPQDRSMAREVDEKEVISVLTQTGSTASYLKEGLLQKIEDAYDHIKTYSILETPPSSLSSYTLEELEVAFQKVQIDVVHGFLGGIFSVFAGHPNRPQWSELIDDGWKFLGKYLTQAFFLVPGLSHEAISRGSSIWEDKWSEPTHLFGYILSLDKDENISPHLILNLLKKWEKVASYKPGTYGIVLNYDTFLEACESLEKKRGKSIWKSKPDVQKDATRPNQNSQQHQMGPTQTIQQHSIQSNEHDPNMRLTHNQQSEFPSTQNPQQMHMTQNQDISQNYLTSNHNSLQDHMRSTSTPLQDNQPSTQIPSSHMPLSYGSFQRNLGGSHNYWQGNTRSPQNIIQYNVPSTSNVQQGPMMLNQIAPQTHMISDHNSLQNEWRSSPHIPQNRLPFIQLPPSYMTSNNHVPHGNMRLDHDILQGAMPSMQNVERITSDHNLRLDKMAGTYMRSNQDVFPNHHASNDWVDGQIIPRLIAESKQDSSKVKIGRFMSRLGENYLYHHSQFEDEIKVFFDGLAKNIVEPRNLPKGTTLTSNVKGKSRDEILLNTIATAENQITTAFVAALFLIHQTQGIQHSWDPILKSGWDFIKSFCSKWKPFLIQYSTNLDLQLHQRSRGSFDVYNPESVIRYLANHKQTNNSPMSLVWDMLKQWHTTEGVTSRFGITESNLDHIQRFHHQSWPVPDIDGLDDWGQRGKNKAQSSRNRQYPTPKEIEDDINSPQSERSLEPSLALSAKVSSVRLSISPEFVVFFRNIGDTQIQNHQHISQTYNKMFKDLQEDLLKILSEDRHDGIYSIDQRSSHNQGFSDNKDLINTALRNAKFQLGPAFLGALKLLYQPHCPQSDWIPILESGLTLLKTYVDQWKDFFKRNRSPTWFSKQEQSILQIDWSNMGDVLNYMGKRKSADAMPTQPLKYLLDLWYKDFMSGQVGTRSVRHRITPPNLSLIEESYISHSVKTRKPGSVNLWNIENDLGRVCRKKRRSSSRQQENVLVAAFRGEEDIRGHGAIRQNEDIRGDDTIQDSQETRGDDITWPDEHINTDGNVVSTSKIPIGDVSLLNSGWNFDGDENVSSNTILDRMKADSALWSDYSSFFETFEREVKVHYEGKSVEPQHTSLRGLYSLTLGETEALNVINVAKNQITTSFMFILSQARSGQKSKEPLENILQSGWNHLKAYFETWEHYILSKEAPIDFPGRRKTVNRIDWSNIPETLRYMATHNQQSTGASHILSHLIDRSYSDVVDLQGNKVKSLAYQLSRPSEKLIQDALSRYKIVNSDI